MAEGSVESADELQARRTKMVDALPLMNADILEQWIDDPSLFIRNFERFAAVVCIRSDCSFEINQDELKRIHTDWKDECQHWRASGKMPDNTYDLNHTKMCGILLRSFCAADYICIDKREPNPCFTGFGGSRAPDENLAARLCDGKGTFVAWLFVHYVMVWFEQNRSDRIEAFEARLSPDFELELVSLLLSGLHSSDALYVLLLALFLRD